MFLFHGTSPMMCKFAFIVNYSFQITCYLLYSVKHHVTRCKIIHYSLQNQLVTCKFRQNDIKDNMKQYMLKFYTNLNMSDYKQKPSGHTLSLVEKESTQMTTSRTCMKLPERNNEFRQKEY